MNSISLHIFEQLSYRIFELFAITCCSCL